MSPDLRAAMASLVVAVINQIVGEWRARQARRVRDDIERQRQALTAEPLRPIGHSHTKTRRKKR